MSIPIEFGTALRSPFDVANSARYIENLDFDILGCGEHVSFHGDTANGFVSLSVAAGVTSKIQLMSTITLVPLYPATLLAKMGAALDVASDGRFIFGVGVGGDKEGGSDGLPERDGITTVTRSTVASSVLGRMDGAHVLLEIYNSNKRSSSGHPCENSLEVELLS